jgi:signal transduction histidine kinase
MMAGYGIARGIGQQIEQSDRAATRSVQLAAVGQLAAGLAHELRNPLTAMRMLVEAGREQMDSGDGLDRRDLEVLDEEIARLEKLVASFLDFARPPRLEEIAIDARILVEQTLHIVSGQARQRGVTMDWQRPAETIMAEADPVQMRQVLLNLMLNAIEAVGECGKVTVELGGEVKPDFKRTQLKDIVIHVSDNGPGVSDEMKEKIFEPFVSSKDTGMGLGLAVSRRIVEAHGGTLVVADNPPGGARFTICLPRSDQHPACRLNLQAESI